MSSRFFAELDLGTIDLGCHSYFSILPQLLGVLEFTPLWAGP